MLWRGNHGHQISNNFIPYDSRMVVNAELARNDLRQSNTEKKKQQNGDRVPWQRKLCEQVIQAGAGGCSGRAGCFRYETSAEPASQKARWIPQQYAGTEARLLRRPLQDAKSSGLVNGWSASATDPIIPLGKRSQFVVATVYSGKVLITEGRPRP